MLNTLSVHGGIAHQRLLQDAFEYAANEIVITAHQANVPARKRNELQQVIGFAETYMPSGCCLERLAVLKQPALAAAACLMRKETLCRK